MADLKKIREEMLNDILEKRKNIPENILKKINLELDFLESTDGLNSKSNLETLYNIYKKRNGQVGHKNNINSIVCYALGLTDKKPEGELLPPRRAFARASFPDVDTDFADIKQDDIFNYLIYKYGRENGSRVGTHQFLNFKSCVTRVAKALDVADSFHKGKDDYITDNAKKVKEILLPFPKKGLMKVKDENGESHIIKNIKDAYDFCQDFRYYMDKYPLLNKYSREIEGTFSGFSQHASGFVLSNTCISDIAPMRKARGGKIATQFVGTELETLGLIKFDILGLATLSVIELALKYIKENYDIDIDIYNLKVDDQKTFQLYQSGRLAGVFQCEQPGMQQTMREMHVDKFEDIMAGIALYRPGPMDSIPEYCARKKGEKPINYFHKSIEPFVKPYLEKTYGLVCIHEDTLISLSNGKHIPIKEKDVVCSYNEKLQKIEGKEVRGCSPTKKCDGYKITLNNGYSITLTEDHKVYTQDGMKEVKNLNILNDIIACPNYLLSNNKKNLFKNIGEDEKIAYLMGFGVGDGCISSNFTLCIGNEEDSIKMEEWINLNISTLKTHRYQHCRSWYISCSGKNLIKKWKFQKVGNRKTEFGLFIDNNKLRKNCYNKRIPEKIFVSHYKTKLAFIAGLMDSDGCIFNYKKEKKIIVTYTSCNLLLLKDLSHLCQLLNINVTISGNKIVFNEQKLFLKLINNYLILKKDKALFAKDWKRKNIYCHKTILENKRKELNLSIDEFVSKLFINKKKYLDNNIFSVRSIRNFVDNYNINKNIMFYKIKSKEVVSNMQFYGMSVEDNHNLIGNGILISNCYQEQIMQICNSLAGFTISDGYVIIKAIGKKKQDLMFKFESQFIKGCINNKVPKDVAKQYWDKVIIPFADYAFNVAHSAAYGFNSYLTAYLKANYPEEFVCAVLEVETIKSNGDKYEKIALLEKEFQKYLPIKFLKRDINHSKVSYIIEKKKDPSQNVHISEIRPSLLCKGMGLNAAIDIEKNQPYGSLKDLATKTNFSVVDARCLDALIESGYINIKKKKKEEIIKEFLAIREDLKKAAKKGIESVDIFEDA